MGNENSGLSGAEFANEIAERPVDPRVRPGGDGRRDITPLSTFGSGLRASLRDPGMTLRWLRRFSLPVRGGCLRQQTGGVQVDKTAPSGMHSLCPACHLPRRGRKGHGLLTPSRPRH